MGFQSTRPLRGATSGIILDYVTIEFQSTRPLRGATSVRFCLSAFAFYFNPRAPCGARRTRDGETRHSKKFQSTRPLRGATSV